MKKILCFGLAVFLLSASAFANFAKTPAASAEALRDTSDTLTSPSKRNQIISKSAEAKNADAQVEALVGSGENKEKLYALAAKLMQSLAQKAGGDPEKMAKLLEEAQKNPEAFANEFSPEERKMLKSLAKAVGKSGKAPLVP